MKKTFNVKYQSFSLVTFSICYKLPIFGGRGVNFGHLFCGKSYRLIISSGKKSVTNMLKIALPEFIFLFLRHFKVLHFCLCRK